MGIEYTARLVLNRDGKDEEYGLRCDDPEDIHELLQSMRYRLMESLKGATFVECEVRSVMTVEEDVAGGT